MDGKQQLNKLDPKLQETYNRVMGTPTIPVPTPPQPGATSTTPPTNPLGTPVATPSPIPPPIPSPSPTPVQPLTTPTHPLPNQPLMHVEEVKMGPTPGTISPTPPLAQPNVTGMHPVQNPAVNPMPTAPNMPQMPPSPGAIPTTPGTATAQPMQPGMHPIPPQMAQGPIHPQTGVTPLPQAPTPGVAPATTDSFHATAAVAQGAPGGHVAAQTHGFVSPKKKSKISPAIIVAGIIVFVVAYTIFWVKFFNVPIPFLTQ